MEFRKLWLLTLVIAGAVVLANAIALSGAKAQTTTTNKNVELILDASGSMNGKLPGGIKKIDAAKEAVTRLVGKLPGDINLSFRAYGHQFHRSKNNCQDTQLLVGFGNVASVGSQVVSDAQALKAQGYTPITYVLGLAADDLKPLAGQKTIILVSDGKETCKGDPCVLAKKLADANADLTIHTVGFGVDFQARTQLQCIARAGRGVYRDANSADELAESLRQVAATEIEEEVVIIVQKDPNGRLEIVGPYFNNVVDAETGEQVTKITNSNNNVKLLAGIYNVQFGKNMWLKSVEVVAGETTTITPGRLKVIKPYFNNVLDQETGEVIEKATGGHNDFPLLAGRYDVAFGKAIWRGVEIREGETTVLNPGRLAMDRPYFNNVLDSETGNVVEKLTGNHKNIPLPPGTYDVTFGKAVWRGFKVSEGETTVLNPGRLAMDRPYFNDVLDSETGDAVEKLTGNHKDIPLPPGTYDVAFGGAIWRGVEIREGETTELKPGRLKMNKPYFNEVFDAETGEKVEKLTGNHNDIPLPPGTYNVKFASNLVQSVTLTSGETLELKPGRIKIEKKGNFFYNLLNGEGQLVIKLTGGTNDIPLPAGKYILDVDGQKVPVTLKEATRKVIKIQ